MGLGFEIDQIAMFFSFSTEWHHGRHTHPKALHVEMVGEISPQLRVLRPRCSHILGCNGCVAACRALVDRA